MVMDLATKPPSGPTRARARALMLAKSKRLRSWHNDCHASLPMRARRKIRSDLSQQTDRQTPERGLDSSSSIPLETVSPGIAAIFRPRVSSHLMVQDYTCMCPRLHGACLCTWLRFRGLESNPHARSCCNRSSSC